VNDRTPRMPAGSGWAPWRWMAILVFFLAAGSRGLLAEDPALAFLEANRLYEEGNYAAAAKAYEQIVQSGKVSSALCFNLGNAWFKHGQLGRAIVCYRQAAALSPRDPDILANLRFARDMVGGSRPLGTVWQRWLSRLTLNEWAALTAALAWSWFLLLAARQWRPQWRPALRSSTIAAGLAGLATALAFGAVLYNQQYHPRAVVIVPEAAVRHGPLMESQSFYTLSDGAEVDVLDRQGEWLQVIDSARRIGWLRQEQVIRWPMSKTNRTGNLLYPNTP